MGHMEEALERIPTPIPAAAATSSTWAWAEPDVSASARVAIVAGISGCHRFAK
jgi:hypothetical protein